MQTNTPRPVSRHVVDPLTTHLPTHRVSTHPRLRLDTVNLLIAAHLLLVLTPSCHARVFFFSFFIAYAGLWVLEGPPHARRLWATTRPRLTPTRAPPASRLPGSGCWRITACTPLWRPCGRTMAPKRQCVLLNTRRALLTESPLSEGTMQCVVVALRASASAFVSFERFVFCSYDGFIRARCFACASSANLCFK